MFDDQHAQVGVFDFEQLANLLVEQGSAVSPARLHGALAGLLAAGAEPLAELGLDAVSQGLDLVAHGELAEQVMSLYRVTAEALADEAFEFHPLLPDDEDELDVRTEGLGDWCAGFLLGFAQQNAATPAQAGALSADSSEILSDLAALAEATVGDEDDDADEAESNYLELVEYVRFAVLNVYTDTRISQAERAGDENANAPTGSVH